MAGYYSSFPLTLIAAIARLQSGEIILEFVNMRRLKGKKGAGDSEARRFLVYCTVRE